MTYDQKRISVLIPLYNHGDYIGHCVSSVADQDYQNIELIIIDDNSDDDGFERARAALDVHEGRFARALLIRNHRNRGATFTLNRALALADGELVAFLNSDDRYHQSRLGKLTSAMAEQKRAWAFSQIEPIGIAGERFWASTDAHKFSREPQQLLEAMPSPSWAMLHFQAAISTGNLLVERDLAIKVGGFVPLNYCHDWAFALACAWHSEPAFVSEALYQYRFHSTNSFQGLNHLTHHDAAEVMRAHCIRAAASQAPNSTYPTSALGSTFYAALSRMLQFDGLVRDLYQPYRPYHRTIESPSF